MAELIAPLASRNLLHEDFKKIKEDTNTEKNNKEKSENSEKGESDSVKKDYTKETKNQEKDTKKNVGKETSEAMGGKWLEEKSNDAPFQNFAKQHEEKQAEYQEARLKHVEMAKDPSISAMERVKAVGMVVADSAMELSEAGQKKFCELYDKPLDNKDKR